MKFIDLFGYAVIVFGAIFVSSMLLAFWDYRVASVTAIIAFVMMCICGNALKLLWDKKNDR